ncbi:MAG: hypothetical protein Q8J69_02915 [Sphingobacteriaceae bacterium]|nr:hypothetical protein [Sphingobacteriaceae bacterium]
MPFEPKEVPNLKANHGHSNGYNPHWHNGLYHHNRSVNTLHYYNFHIP